MTTDEIMAELRARHREVVAFVESCPDELWTQELPDGERTVAAVASHIGRAYDLQREIFETLLRGQPPPTRLARPITLPEGEGPPIEEIIRGGALGHPSGHLQELRETTS